MAETPKRRCQFSLRTLLIAVALLSLSCGWVSYSLRWIAERREALEVQGKKGRRWVRMIASGEPTTAPVFLWVFGEEGALEVIAGRDDAEYARRLFPEAKIIE